MTQTYIREIPNMLIQLDRTYKPVEVVFRKSDPELDYHKYIIEDIFIDKILVSEMCSESFYEKLSIQLDKLGI